MSAFHPFRPLDECRIPAAFQPCKAKANCYADVVMKPDEPTERKTITAIEVVAYLVVGLCFIFTINLALDWVGRQLGSDIMEIGRGRDLGFVLSLVLGLMLTREVAAWAGFTPKK
jgi:hypothetical protein